MTDAVDKPATPLVQKSEVTELKRKVSGDQGIDALKNIVFGSELKQKVSVDQGVEALKDIVFGSIAGIIGKIIEYPFDTVKVRLQSQPDYLPLRYGGPIDCFRQSWHEEGLRGLYRGVSAPLAGAAIETSSLFFSYRIAQELIRSTQLNPKDGMPLSLEALTVCGAASGAFTSLLLTPIELVKCQMQVPSSASSLLRAQKPLPIISSIFRHHGIFGFWHGHLGTLIRETGGSAAWFGVYETVSVFFRLRNERTSSLIDSPRLQKLPLWQQMLAGGSAGVAYTLACFPADTIKSRMQTENLSTSRESDGGRRKRNTFRASGLSLWRQQGMKGLYRGCGITVAKSAPSSAFIFAIYDALSRAFS